MLYRDKSEEAQWAAIFTRVNEHRSEVIAEQQAFKARQNQSESRSSEDIPSFTGKEAGIERLSAWADIAQDVLQAGDEIEAMPLDDVEYHVSSGSLRQKPWTAS